MPLSKARNRERMRAQRGSFVPETIVPFGMIANLDERKAWLTSIIRKPLPETIGVNSMLMAADQLNKLDRLYAPELPSSTNIDNRTQILMAYSPEQLRALSQELRALLSGEDKTSLPLPNTSAHVIPK